MTHVTDASGQDDANASPSVSDELVDPPPEGVDVSEPAPLDLQEGESARQRVNDGPLPESSDELARLLAQAFDEAAREAATGGPAAAEDHDELDEEVERFRSACYRLIELGRLGA